jgi:NhaP-type Na+/H+ or K+/H+ antiporter
MADALAVGVLVILVGGVTAQWLAWRFRLPAIVLLLVVGLLAGPVFQVIHPSHAMGGTLGPLVGLAVCIVVFEGGLALNLKELKAAGEGVIRLTVVALPISFALGTIAARLCTGMSLAAAMLYGAITVVTGPTVILPLLRHTRLDRRAASFLKWEAIVNDPVGALLAAVVLDIVTVQKAGFSSVLLAVVAGAVFAVALGVAAALLVRFLFTRDLMPEPLKTPVLLALAMGVYVLGNLGVSEAGLIAATVFGMTLANLRVPGIAELRRFKESLVVLIVSVLFITLAADLDRHVLTQLSWPLIGLTTVMLILVRPLR